MTAKTFTALAIYIYIYIVNPCQNHNNFQSFIYLLSLLSLDFTVTIYIHLQHLKLVIFCDETAF